jgi:predicted helicase
VASVHEVIEAFRKAPSNSERGTRFEQLMVHYFQLDPMLAQQYEQVWRWMDWPGRDGKPDIGIDLVASERDTGAYTAIQCNFYEPTSTLAKSDIDLFVTASGKKPFTNRIIISTTDRWGKTRRSRVGGSVDSGAAHRVGGDRRIPHRVAYRGFHRRDPRGPPRRSHTPRAAPTPG